MKLKERLKILLAKNFIMDVEVEHEDYDEKEVIVLVGLSVRSTDIDSMVRVISTGIAYQYDLRHTELCDEAVVSMARRLSILHRELGYNVVAVANATEKELKKEAKSFYEKWVNDVSRSHT